MEIQVKYVDGMEFESFARGHRVIADQPVPTGHDRGMTPPELFLSALGSCAMYYGVAYIRARKLSVDGLGVHVIAEKGGHPARLVDIRIEVDAPAVDSDRREGLKAAVHTCLLHQTMLTPPAIRIEVKPPVAAMV